MEDLHACLRTDWSKVWEQLRTTPLSHLPEKQEEILQHMMQLDHLAKKIGGSLERDVEKLVRDVRHFLSGDMSLSEASRMMEEALRVEQDTREL